MFVTPGSRANRKRIGSGGGSSLPLVGNGLTVTTSTPLLDLSQTWNAGAVAFTAAKINVTNTASAAASLLLDLQVGGASRFNVATTGNADFVDGNWDFNISYSNGIILTALFGGSSQGSITWNNGAGTTIVNPSNKNLVLSGTANGIQVSSDVSFTRQGAGLWAIQNQSTLSSASGLRVYNTTDSEYSPTNYERAVFDWTSTPNVLTIGTKIGGTGVARAISIEVDTKQAMGIATTGIVSFPWGLATTGGGSANFSSGIGVTGDIVDSATGRIYWSTRAVLGSPSDGVLYLTNNATTGAGALYVYNVADNPASPTNYERAVFDWVTTANVLTIGTQKGGTGTGRSLKILEAANGTSFDMGSSGSIIQANCVSWVFSSNTIYLNGALTASITIPAAGVTKFGGPSTNGYIQWDGQTRVTTNFTSSNATLTAITGISSVALQAGRNYSFRAWLAVTGSSLAGVQVGITCSSTTITTLLSDGYMHDAGVMRGSSVGVINSTGTPVVAVSSATVTSSNPSIRIDGMIRVGSSGLFGLTLAQSTASATQTIVSSASFMIVYDMP